MAVRILPAVADVLLTRTQGGSIICFSVAAKASAAGSRRRLLQTGLDATGLVLNYAAHSSNVFTQHAVSGGLTLNAVGVLDAACGQVHVLGAHVIDFVCSLSRSPARLPRHHKMKRTLPPFTEH